MKMPTADDIRLACGELTAQEMRTAKAVLTWFIATRSSEADQRDAPEGTWCWTKTAIAVPRDGDTVLCYWAKDKLHRMDKYIGEAEYGGGQWYNPENDEDDYRVPTHWMPLPPSPTDTEESNG